MQFSYFLFDTWVLDIHLHPLITININQQVCLVRKNNQFTHNESVHAIHIHHKYDYQYNIPSR